MWKEISKDKNCRETSWKWRGTLKKENRNNFGQAKVWQKLKDMKSEFGRWGQSNHM